MKYKEIVKEIYKMRDSILSSVASSKEIDLTILSQINSQFFLSPDTIPEILCLELTSPYSAENFESTVVKLLKQLGLENKLLRKEHLPSKSFYFFKIIV